MKGVATNQAHGVHCVMSGGVHLPDSVASVCRRVLSSWSVKSREPLVSHTRTVGAIQDPVNDSRKCKSAASGDQKEQVSGPGCRRFVGQVDSPSGHRGSLWFTEGHEPNPTLKLPP